MRMRFRTVVLAGALSIGLSQTGDAFAPQKGADHPTVVNGRAPRAHRDIAWSAPARRPAAFASLPGWRAQWDRDTDVPLRLWGPPIAAPRASADPAAAEAAARLFLAAHLDLLAPGAKLSDFALAANQLDAGGIRTVTFLQHAQGLPVVGGSVGFEFRADQLMLVGSTALPDVVARMPGGALPDATIETSAIDWLGRAGYKVAVRSHGDRVIVPIVRPRGRSAMPVIEYRVVETVSVEALVGAGRWDVWIDAADASPVARHSTINFATGTVMFNVPDRYPGGTRGPKPAPYATHKINGAAVTATIGGSVTWNTTTNATVVPGLAGTYAAITNKSGALDTASLTLAPGGSVTWDQHTIEQSDAQLDSYVFENTVKEFVRTKLNPSLTWLDKPESVNVNEPMTCNAYSTGDDIHFFIANTMCENTGRIADVVYHETGHSVHFNSIIPGQGVFDSSLSEGLADTMAVSITGDSGMGRGFFFTSAPLRDVNPTVKKKWPQDADGEPHDEGEIIGEALWDTRVALQTKLGTAAGFAQFLKIYYSVMQRAADIPSSFPEALAGDDDDGNLANGTPNQCELQAAFAAHGLVDPAATLGIEPPSRNGYNVSLTVTPPSASCGTPIDVQSASLDWNPRGGTGGSVALAQSGTTWTAAIPAQADGTLVEYSVTLTFTDGSTLTYPQNKAYPKYQYYVGAVTPIKCWDFEAGASDWTHSANPAANDEWAVGPPLGLGGDPKAAHGGSNVFGIDLGADDGLYSPNTKQWADAPAVDLGGATNVHLQYYRWLNVEDGVYDQGTISANGTQVWTNFASTGMPTTDEVNFTDHEWQFHDVDLSAQAASGKIQLHFELDSDPGLELGGWTLDDVCLVAIGGPAPPTCGNGVVDPGEQCDDGNTTNGDGCSSTCQDETTSGAKMAGGCCSASGGATASLGLALVTLGLVLGRRRRSR
jgi:uncharacterized protein (TIGR03382 family)